MKSLQQEIQQTRPFDSTGTEAMLNLMRTHAVIMQPLNQFFREHGLTETLYNVLRIVRGADDEGVTCTQIGERMLTRVPDVTRLIDRLVKAQWVRRHRQEEDRRVVMLHLTAKGRSLLTKLESPLKSLHEALLAHMSEQELETLNQLLTKLRQSGVASE